VEVHFSLKHYHIQCEGETGFNSFTANIEQINVVKQGAPKATNPYKQKNPRDGPLDVKRPRMSTHPNAAFASATEGTAPVVIYTIFADIHYTVR